MINPLATTRNSTWLSLLMLLLVWQCVDAQQFTEKQGNNNQIPDAAKDIGVDPRLGEFVDPEFSFTDEDNNFVRMGDYFDNKRPIILSFNYSNCPKLCEVQLDLMTDALREIDFEVGKDFQLVSVSIDPKEQLARVRDMRDRFSGLYNRPGSEDSWNFLVSKDPEMVKELAKACGVRYKYVPRQKLYSHPPVFLLLSPKGKIVRYIHGVQYEPVTISRALIEASEGKIGSPINRFTFVTGCFLFDETTGKYSFAAMGLMRLAGLFTMGCLAISILPYWWVKRSRNDKTEIAKKDIDAKSDTDKDNEYKEVFKDEL
jgi:protein SCO1/2